MNLIAKRYQALKANIQIITFRNARRGFWSRAAITGNAIVAMMTDIITSFAIVGIVARASLPYGALVDEPSLSRTPTEAML